MKYPRNTKLIPFARQMRKASTKEERKLWFEFLRHCEPRFRRQEIIGSYIADFFCYDAALVIELDGSQHYCPSGKANDQERTDYFRSLGISVLRYSNTDIHENFRGVCEHIEHAFSLMGIQLVCHPPQ